MWTKARNTIEEVQLLRLEWDAQIEELAKSNGFRRQYATRMLMGVLDAAMERTGATLGNIQLYDPCQEDLRV